MPEKLLNKPKLNTEYKDWKKLLISNFNFGSYREKSFSVYYVNISGLQIYNQEANTEADARAKLLIYLLENKLI